MAAITILRYRRYRLGGLKLVLIRSAVTASNGVWIPGSLLRLRRIFAAISGPHVVNQSAVPSQVHNNNAHLSTDTAGTIPGHLGVRGANMAFSDFMVVGR